MLSVHPQALQVLALPPALVVSVAVVEALRLHHIVRKHCHHFSQVVLV
jgi:hypothetical protein